MICITRRLLLLLFGNWGNEMNKHQIKLTAGKYVISSYTGSSSNRNNPFFMLSDDDTSENKGSVMVLIWFIVAITIAVLKQLNFKEPE